MRERAFFHFIYAQAIKLFDLSSARAKKEQDPIGLSDTKEKKALLLKDTKSE